MNLYMIVEGKKTETSVYPAWLSILAPKIQRVADPRAMPSFDAEKNKAEYHYYYIRKMFAERNMLYKKTKTDEVQKPDYLQQLVSRYTETDHITTFGQWYNFITKNFK